jgi:hypothetical protein
VVSTAILSQYFPEQELRPLLIYTACPTRSGSKSVERQPNTDLGREVCVAGDRAQSLLDLVPERKNATPTQTGQ